MTSFYEMMRTINRLKTAGTETLNRADVKAIFGRDDMQLAEELEYLGCEANKVADLFNVTLPETKYTREELNRQKKLEAMIF